MPIYKTITKTFSTAEDVRAEFEGTLKGMEPCDVCWHDLEIHHRLVIEYTVTDNGMTVERWEVKDCDWGRDRKLWYAPAPDPANTDAVTAGIHAALALPVDGRTDEGRAQIMTAVGQVLLDAGFEVPTGLAERHRLYAVQRYAERSANLPRPVRAHAIYLGVHHLGDLEGLQLLVELLEEDPSRVTLRRVCPWNKLAMHGPGVWFTQHEGRMFLIEKNGAWSITEVGEDNLSKGWQGKNGRPDTASMKAAAEASFVGLVYQLEHARTAIEMFVAGRSKDDIARTAATLPRPGTGRSARRRAVN